MKTWFHKKTAGHQRIIFLLSACTPQENETIFANISSKFCTNSENIYVVNLGLWGTFWFKNSISKISCHSPRKQRLLGFFLGSSVHPDICSKPVPIPKHCLIITGCILYLGGLSGSQSIRYYIYSRFTIPPSDSRQVGLKEFYKFENKFVLPPYL
jgi:hypothetical protein